jgi:hemerythrin superfamily protein
MSIKSSRRKEPRTRPPGVRQIRRAEQLTKPTSAVALLRADHREVEALFKEFKRADTATDKHAIAQRICAALTVHARIEEEVFYPAFIAATGEQAIHDEAVVEHDGAKKLIAEIEGSAPRDALYDAKVNVLSEMVKHHVKEEERFGGMFFKARLAKMDLAAVGALLQARKQAITREPTATRREPPETRRRARAPKTKSPFTGSATLARTKHDSRTAARRPS